MPKGFTTSVRLLFILYMAAVLCLCFLDFSMTSTMDVPATILGIESDKVVHFFIFLPFPVFLMILGAPRGMMDRPLGILTLLSACMIFPASTELVQEWFLPARDGDILDLAADLAGEMSGYLIHILLIVPFLKRKFSN